MTCRLTVVAATRECVVNSLGSACIEINIIKFTKAKRYEVTISVYLNSVKKKKRKKRKMKKRIRKEGKKKRKNP